MITLHTFYGVALLIVSILWVTAYILSTLYFEKKEASK